MNHLPNKYEHLVRYYGYYSNRSRGARLIQKVYEVDRLECPDCGATLRIITLIDDPGLCGVFFIRRMSGNGRKRPLKIDRIPTSERPLLRKADIALLIPQQPLKEQHFGSLNVRFAPKSGH